jgi:hypothetical protein
VRKILLFKSVQCFVKKDKTSLSVPKGYFVLRTFCPKDRSVAGTFQPGTLCPRTFRPGTFRQGTLPSLIMSLDAVQGLRVNMIFIRGDKC